MATTFVAVGDSFTEGLCDGPSSDGTYAGWADRVATALAHRHGDLRYANLAVRGKLLDEVVRAQLPAALDASPDVLSFHAGGNDILRTSTDLDDVAARYDDAVRRSTEAAGTVVLFTVLERSGPPNRVADRLAARIRRFNDAVRSTATRHDACLVDVGGVTALHDRRLWAEDRLHLSTDGHERVAAAAAEALGLAHDDPGWWRQPLPTPSPAGVVRRVRDDGRWVARHLAPWVWRRIRGVSSGDGAEPKRPHATPWPS